MNPAMHAAQGKSFTVALVICGLFLAVGLLRLNALSLYTPDSSEYLILGNSLAHGKGFVDDTQPEIDRFVVNAPLYPVLIAPVEYFFPLSIIAVKVWTLVLGAIAVFLFYLYLKRLLGERTAIIGATLFAFNPIVLLFSSEMLSEAPFITLMMAIFLFSESAPNGEGVNRRVGSICTVILLSCIALLREVGAAIVLAFVLESLLHKKFRRAAVYFAGSAALAGLWYYRNQIWVSSLQGPRKGNLYLVTQHFVTPPNASIVNEFVLRFWQSGNAYVGHLCSMFFYSFSSTQYSDLLVAPGRILQMLQSGLQTAGIFITIILLVVMVAGIIQDLRQRQSAIRRLAAMGIFCTIVFVYPVHDIRFLIPLYPLFIFYLLSGIKCVVGKFSFFSLFRNRSVQYVLSAFILVPNLIGIDALIKTNQAYLISPKKLIQVDRNISSLYLFDWRTLGDWIGSHLSEQETFASPLKELAVIAGGRKVLNLDPGTTVADFEIALRNNHIDYILAAVEGDLNLYEFQMTRTRRFWFEPVCDAENLHLLRVHSVFLDPVKNNRAFAPQDTIASIRMMHDADRDMSLGLYARAESTLTVAHRLFPRHPAIVYATMTAAYMRGDTMMGNTMYEELLSLPQTLSYTKLAAVQIDAIHYFHTSQSSGMMEERAVTRLKAASLYWKLGYYRYAAELMDTLMTGNSQYFFGLAWSIHFNIQNGDTARARQYLARVTAIDSASVLGNAFTRILRLGDSVRTATSDSERSELHRSIATIYAAIDLKEECIDEAEMALRENPANCEAEKLIGRIYERKGAIRTAEEIFRKVLHKQPADIALLAHADSLKRTLDQ